MKLAFLLSFALSLPAFANKEESVFKQGTVVPVEYQWDIIAAVEKQCAKGVSYYSLTEESSTEEIIEVDQGVRDREYTTLLKTRYVFDGAHPTFAYITVKSKLWDVTNPSVDKFDILSITADADICDAK